MATKKSSGSSRLGRDARPKYLGVKLYDGQKVKTGMIIARQKGTKIRAGKNVNRGRDNTLYAKKNGVIKFNTKRIKRFDGFSKRVKVVKVV